LCGEVQSLLAAAALPIDGHPGYRLREPGAEQRPAGRVAGLLTNLTDRTADDVINDSWVDPGPVDQSPEHMGMEVDGMDV
jgi:hypothetical protein